MRSACFVGAWISVLLALSLPAAAAPPQFDPLDDLMEVNPYSPHAGYPKLVTPQWIGEPGVEAAVVLAIDDMSDPARYEAYLRPILERLKQIDGRAPVSIMTCKVRPDDPRLQQWLKEGLSIEVHTLSHPCPMLQKGDFAAAAKTFHDCVDLISQIPGNRPVAFRVPCCDSLNTPSPRFYEEIFNRVSPDGHFLSIDSSIFNVFTSDDAALPRDLVQEPDGRERFQKYLPKGFVNTIENYPYPYVLGNLCWEFPCAVPSDWEAQHIQKPFNPRTVEDMKAALDLVVLKRGVFNLVFHPHGWIRNDQIVELIDHAVRKHGNKVKFLNFREAQERLNQNLLGGQPLRNDSGADNQVRIFDLDKDGYMDVRYPAVRTWNPKHDAWESQPSEKFPALPMGRARITEPGRDLEGVRFVDIDEDGHVDQVYSNERDYGIFLFDPATKGFTRKVMAGKAGEPGALPKIVTHGTNNGFFVHSRQLVWQNEHTARLPDHVDRRSFNELLKDLPPTGKSPRASLDSIRVAPGFTVELVASEPLVKDPIAMDWGADGKFWVVEMGDYPLGTDGKGKPGGVVRFLEDTNGDGVYDKQTTFIDGLPFPTGVMAWRNGVIVAAAPEIFYAEDRDGDGKADIREVLFTGFTEGNQQHRINGFELGLDGWVYGANGDSGGSVRSLKTGRAVNIQGRDFRFKPDTGEFETESGQTQYGRHRNDWGDWFGNNNPAWGWHFVLAEADLKRNPHFAPPDPRQPLEPDTRLHPVSRTLARFNDPEAANHVTSANSPTPYRDDLFGPHFGSSLFVSEPVHNLVHRMVLTPDGASLKGARAPGEETREFVASSDNWFRPTQLKTGPDGALWIADMYRAVIEHPEWIPPETQKKIDLRAGSEEGRIYRVFPVDRRPRSIPRLDGLDVKGLVAAMDSPSGWQRDTAQRLLMHKQDPATIELLRSLVRTTTNPKTRVQAVWTLAVLGGLDEPTALAALADARPEVRRNVIRAADGLLSTSPRLAEAVAACADDPDASVRLQAALALGDWHDPKAGSALARIARRDAEDLWIRTAVLSSAVPHVAIVLPALFQGGMEPPRAIVEPLVALAGSIRDERTILSVIDVLSAGEGQGGRTGAWRLAALRGLLDATGRAGQPIDLDRHPGLLRLLAAARTLARDEAAPEADRLAAIRLLGVAAGRQPADRDLLLELLSPRVPIALQQAVIDGLARTADPKLPDLWLRGWKTHSPTLRLAILDRLLSRKAWIEGLLSSLEDRCVATAEIDPAHRASLLTQRDPLLRRRAEAVFAHVPGTRQAVVDAYKPALALKGDSTTGKAVFQRVCATCHKLGETGFEVGPNLAALKEKSPEAILIAVLDPNRAFESRYGSFTMATTDGRVLSGLISSEAAAAVTLRRQEGKEDVVLRRDIEELKASGLSIMPEGMEKDLSHKDLADVIAFLEGIGPPPKSIPGNHPQAVRPAGDGKIVLPATNAEIRGTTLVFEPQYGNLGYWASADDHAVWKLEGVKPGRYEVWMEWACPDDAAGNVLEIRVGERRLVHEVRSTGTWDRYELKPIGEIELGTGSDRLELRPAAAPRNALLDLRRIELRPAKPAVKGAFHRPDDGNPVCSCCTISSQGG
jgi:putative membrane-bound dehydrogenase-like protein